ncbi:MAG: hypothetical protein H6662_13360 [Ardenticatenaceae bacterium]|nr:hypothetical protein [Anaerolineales bacterium]MCB8922568.1 hypothetical protein [Ardenticatenaceae bacterium]MCB8991236.1 hypothetical protein [Ardenticatenaceae bacterium]MCB9003723.1 hypothetical protein [Ardenticatenaceae bacterium]
MQRMKAVGILALILMVALTACLGSASVYRETFDEAGSWRVGNDADAEGQVIDGKFDMLVKADNLFIWTTAGKEFGDATYEVEATQVDGPLNNGYGMLFRVDDDRDDFYVFEISGDGYVWIGRYRNGGEDEIQPIIGEWWVESSAINQGLEQMNKLKVEAEGANLIFYVNDQEVGRVTDDAFSKGDVGLMVETLGEGNVRIQFDNFLVTPIIK